MLVKTTKYSHIIENTNTHYKMYKANKTIIYASLLSATMIGTIGLINNTQNSMIQAHADTIGTDQNGGGYATTK